MELFIFSLDLTKTSAVESAISIQKAAEQHLSQLIPELCKSDLEVAELEKQVKEFMFSKKIKVNGTQTYEIKKDEINEGKSKSESSDESSDDTYQECRTRNVDPEMFKDHSIATVCICNI